MRTRWPIGTLSPPNWRLGLGKLRNAQTVCRYSDTASDPYCEEVAKICRCTMSAIKARASLARQHLLRLLRTPIREIEDIVAKPPARMGKARYLAVRGRADGLSRLARDDARIAICAP